MKSSFSVPGSRHQCIETDTIEKLSCRPSSRLYFKDKFRLIHQQLKQRSDTKILSSVRGGWKIPRKHTRVQFSTHSPALIDTINQSSVQKKSLSKTRLFTK